MLGNIRGLANGATRAVNPNLPATLWIARPPTIVNFVQTPQYDQLPVFANVQAMTSGDVRQLDSLNIQGAEKVIFLNGIALAINRIQKLGGDLIVFRAGLVPEGTTWKIAASLEQWGSTWAKVAVSLQDDDLSS